MAACVARNRVSFGCKSTPWLPALDSAYEIVRDRRRPVPERRGIAWKQSGDALVRSSYDWVVLVLATAAGSIELQADHPAVHS